MIMSEENEPCMHCDINDVVRKYLDRNTTIDLSEFVGQMTDCLAELIPLAPEDQRANMFAEAMRGLGESYLVKLGLLEEGTATAH
jgi:hypothetical protein